MFFRKHGQAGQHCYGNIGLWVLLLVLTFLLQHAGLMQSLRYDRQQVAGGHWWLLLSGHLVHAGWPHWALNMAGLGMVAVFFSRYGSLLQWLWVSFMAALFAGTGVYLFNPALATGVGLSAVLHGLFVFGAINEIRHQPLSGWILLALLCGKLAWEFLFGSGTGAEALASGRVATDAHLYGALGAAVATGMLSLVEHIGHVSKSP